MKKQTLAAHVLDSRPQKEDGVRDGIVSGQKRDSHVLTANTRNVTLFGDGVIAEVIN